MVSLYSFCLQRVLKKEDKEVMIVFVEASVLKDERVKKKSQMKIKCREKTHWSLESVDEKERERKEDAMLVGDLKIKVSPFHLLFFSFSSITINLKQTLFDRPIDWRQSTTKCEVEIKPNLIFMVLYFIFRYHSILTLNFTLKYFFFKFNFNNSKLRLLIIYK